MEILSLLNDPVIRPTALGTAMLGAVSGGVGAFAVVRRQSLQGDAVSHAAMPGLAFAFWLGGRSELVLLLGAAVAGWIALSLVQTLTRRGGATFDSALAATLSVFFGLGLVLLTYLQRQYPGTSAVRLQQYLFGAEAATMQLSDLVPVLGLGLPALVVLFVCWKEFKILSFDPDFAASLGYPTRRLDYLLTAVVVAAVVIGLQTVGVVLMSAMIVAPGAAARQWTDRLGRVVILAMVLGATAGLIGTFTAHALSERGRAIPTGPTIVMMATLIALFSLAFAPRRGLFPQWLSRQFTTAKVGVA
jgi:manganese/zinc/iron transport system permease protein